MLPAALSKVHRILLQVCVRNHNKVLYAYARLSGLADGVLGLTSLL